MFYPILRTSWCEKIRKKNKKTHPYISNVVPTSIALLIVWSLIGLWHGADWSYVAHGLFHGTIIILSTILGPIYSKIDLNYNFIRKKDNTSTNNLISNDANQFHFIKSSPLSTKTDLALRLSHLLAF